MATQLQPSGKLELVRSNGPGLTSNVSGHAMPSQEDDQTTPSPVITIGSAKKESPILMVAVQENNLPVVSESQDWEVSVTPFHDSILMGSDMLAANVTIQGGGKVFIGGEPVLSYIAGRSVDSYAVSRGFLLGLRPPETLLSPRPKKPPDPPDPPSLLSLLLL